MARKRLWVKSSRETPRSLSCNQSVAPAIPIAETVGAMKQLVDRGKVSFIGAAIFTYVTQKIRRRLWPSTRLSRTRFVTT